LVGLQLVERGLELPARRVERSQLGGRGALGVEDRRHEVVGRVLCGWPSRIIDLILDDAYGPSGAPGQLGAERAVRDSLEVSVRGVLLHAPNEITATFRELAEQLVGATEAPVGKDEHARATGGGKWLGDGVLPLARAPDLRREHRVGAAFGERDDADLGEGGLSPSGVVPPERREVARRVRHVEDGPVHRHEPLAPVVRPPSRSGGNRNAHTGEQRLEGLFAETLTRLRDRNRARNL
jgi:hypothetical protein